MKLIGIQDYEPFIGAEAADRIAGKAAALGGMSVVNFNSTYYGGGVAEMLSGLTLLMNAVGIPTEWRVIQGQPEYFSVTKQMHNALQGGELDFESMRTSIFEDVIAENAVRNTLDHDWVIVHDPQPLPLIEHYRKKTPWIWRCHIDLSEPHPALWNYLKGFVERYDVMIASCPEYRQELETPQRVFMPAIDPFNAKNRSLPEDEMDAVLAKYDIPTDLPLVVQVSRFDRWKDPEGVIEAFKIARERVDATLVLLGNFATDDPEGSEVYDALTSQRDERIIILACGDDTGLVNALQCRAAVVLQKSIREGFGLTVAEAMLKGTPVIGGNVGGIKYQIRDGENGFLVSSVEEAAERIVELVKDEAKREAMGERAQESVKDGFLLSRYLEQYLDLFASCETNFRFRE